jgi:hypothetical protein
MRFSRSSGYPSKILVAIASGLRCRQTVLNGFPNFINIETYSPLLMHYCSSPLNSSHQQNLALQTVNSVNMLFTTLLALFGATSAAAAAIETSVLESARSLTDVSADDVSLAKRAGESLHFVNCYGNGYGYSLIVVRIPPSHKAMNGHW